MAGGYVELLGFLLLIPVLVFLARALGLSQIGRGAAQSALVAGGAYVALAFSPGLAAGATPMYAAHGAAGVDTASVMNNLRVITYVVSLMLLGAHAIGIAITALGDRFSPRLVGWRAHHRGPASREPSAAQRRSAGHPHADLVAVVGRALGGADSQKGPIGPRTRA
jgi:hypothetical protein